MTSVAAAAEWRRVEGVVDAALDAPPAERARVVADACGGDEALRAAAMAWLDACDGGSAGPLDASIDAWRDDLLADDAPDDDDDAPPSLVGTFVGPWQLLGELGRGGMGIVYVAERADAELTMRAALKLAAWGGGDPHAARRFREERRILAGLAHPNIARLLDGGVTENGAPWFAMELVDGRPIDVWCDAAGLAVEARLRLFCRVCDAVAHAHARLVVHRDLKPSNVLVTAEGEPKLLDFGIAKLLDPDGSQGDDLTRPGARLMTPAFAAPEQLRGEPVSTATDVHALGALLHLLLAGSLPYGRAGDGLGLAELERRVVAGHGPRPSEVAPAHLRRRLRGDLDTIVARAMHAEPGRRYPTADALAADVRRHLDGRPVLARPDTLRYRLRKLAARHPLGIAAGAAAAVALVAFSTVTATQAARLRVQAAHLAAERDKANEVTRFLSTLLSSADPYETSNGRPPTLRDVLDLGAGRAPTDLRDRPEVRAHLYSAMSPAYFGLGDWERAVDLADSAVILRRRAAEPDEPDLAAALVYVANVKLNAGRPADAESHAREALSIIHRHPGLTDLDSAHILGTLAAALQKQGRLAEAEPVLRTLLAAYRPTKPPREVANVARNLGHVLRDRRAYAQAVPLYDEAYTLHRRTFGDEHPETANSAVNLGWSLFLAGDTARAESLVRAGVTVKRRLLGLAHPDVAKDQGTLARIVEARGRHAEAAALVAEADRAVRAAGDRSARR